MPSPLLAALSPYGISGRSHGSPFAPKRAESAVLRVAAIVVGPPNQAFSLFIVVLEGQNWIRMLMK